MRSCPRRNLEYSRLSLFLIVGDGFCAIDPFLSPGKPYGVATDLDFKRGAAEVLTICGDSGIAKNISKHV